MECQTMAKTESVLDLPVEFGGVSIGDSTARLGVRFDRTVLDLIKADEVFCGHRLTGSVILGGKDDQSGQTKFVEDLSHQVAGTFDVKRIGVNQTEIVTGLTFSLADLDVAELAKFSKGSGRLLVNEVGELPDDSGDDDSNEREDEPGSLATDQPWREVKIATLFKGQKSLIKNLQEAKIETVGALADFTSKEHSRLTDIKGIGPGAAEKIEKRLEDFWADNNQ
jgi:hypothetical protein